MSNRAKRKRRAEEARTRKKNENICINCGERGAHFFPPCFGDPGFFVCDQLEKQEKDTPS